MLILKQNAANSVPTPPSGKGTIFLDDSDVLSVKTSDGNVENFPTVAASNAQVVFINGTSLSGENAFTYDFNNNVLNVSGNIAVGNLKTDNLLYSNGSPWDLSDPGGSNTQIQFNDDESFGGSAAFTFNKTSNLVTMTGNLTAANVNAGNLLSANFVAGTLTTAAQPNITSVGTLTNVAVTGNVAAGNVYANSGTIGANLLTGTLTTASQPNITSVGTLTSLGVTNDVTAGNVYANSGVIAANLLTGTLTTASQPNITSVGTLGTLSVTGNANVGNIGGNNAIFTSIAGTLTTAAQPNVTSVGTLSALGVNGNLTAANITANTGVFTGNGAGLTNIAGANVTGTVANATHASTANTVTTAAQPNITSVGTLTSLVVTGNVSSGNVVGGNLVSANFVTGVLTTASQGNITSVGTLTGLSVDGSNITLANGVYVGNGAGLSSVAGANVTGTVANATYATSAGTAGTVTTAAQPNITSVGTLSSLAVTGNVAAGNVYSNSGTIGASLLTGTLTTAAQPNVTSIGTLTSLAVTGNVTSGNVGATGKVVASTLESNVATGTAPFTVASTTKVTNLNADLLDGFSTATAATANTVVIRDADGSFSANVVTATLSGAATTAGTVTTAAQPNITSVGTLSSLTVTGKVTAGQLQGDGGNISNIQGANVSGTVSTATTAGTVTTAAQPNITSVGTLSSLAVTGNVTGANFVGNLANGNSSVAIPAAAGNVNVTVNGTANVLVVTATGANVAGTLNASGNANVGNLGTAGLITATGNVSGGNLTTAGVVAATGNVSGGNLTTAGALSVTGNANVGNIGAAAGVFTTVAGSLTTASQPNVTSLGTLSSLAVTGNGTFGNVYANSGTVGASLLTGTLTTAAQPNVTSVGTLTSVTVTGNVAAGNLTTTGILSVTGTGTSSIAGNLDMTSNNIINLAAPVNSTDAATKQYVDDIAQGLHVHAPSAAATPDTLANISGGTITYNNGTSGVGATLTTTGTYTTIDTVNIASVGTRILVKNEANAAHNGIYTYTSSTVLTRATDFDTPAEMAGGDFTFVSGGATYNDTGWVMTDPVTTVGTTNVVFVQFSGAGTYTAGTGLTLTGSAFSVNASQTQVTSVGTLTGLAVNGTITAANITANTGVFTGNGAALTNLNASNISSGTLAQARLANASLSVNGQSISLGDSGTITANTTQTLTLGSFLTGTSFNGGTAVTANVDATSANTASKVVARDASGNFSAGTITATLSGAATTAGTVTTNAQPNITSVGTLTSLTVNGNITQTSGYEIMTTNASVTAAGTAQGNATAITSQVNVTSTVPSGSGVVMPTAAAGLRICIINTAANAVLVYPASGGTINSLAANAAYSLGAGGRLDFQAVSSTQWYTLNATYA